MDQKEINYIGEDLYQRCQKDKQNGEWTEHDLKLEAELYADLKEIGFDFYWHMQLSPRKFTKEDKAIVPIFVKYFDKFDDDGLNIYPIECLGVPKLYEATKYILELYYKHCGKFSHKLDYITFVLYSIGDPHYIKEYMQILNDEENLTEAEAFIVDLVGKLKVKEAIPRLIELLDFVLSEEQGKFNPECICTSAILALGKYKNPEHIKYITKFLDKEKYPYPIYQEYAAKSIKKMGGHVEKVKDEKGKKTWVLIDD